MTGNPTHSRPAASRPSCRDVVELAPWLLNGSLERGEELAMREHLASCESCSLELEEAVRLRDLMTWHLPSLTLAQYAQGLVAEELPRELVERHLAACPQCREDLERAMPEPVADFAAARAARTARRHTAESHSLRTWRRLAIAAGIAAVVSTGGLLSSLAERQVPPASATARAAGEQDAGPGQAAEEDVQRDIFFSDGFESGDILSWSKVQEQGTAPISG